MKKSFFSRIFGSKNKPVQEKYTDIKSYTEELKQIEWLKNSGSDSEKYHVIHSVFEAYDNWNLKMLAVWEPHINALEAKAAAQKGDAWIDEVFNAVSDALRPLLWEKWGAYIERSGLQEECGLDNEMLDMIMRDAAWAYIEQAIDSPAFFAELLEIYKDGYFPCSWEGDYPEGKAVVL